MKRSQSVVLGLLLTAGVGLAWLTDSGEQEQEEEGYYGSKTYNRVYYNHTGTAYFWHEDNILRPMPADHPNYSGATREGVEMAAGRQSHGGVIGVRRSGFGSSAVLHVSSSGS